MIDSKDADVFYDLCDPGDKYDGTSDGAGGLSCVSSGYSGGSGYIDNRIGYAGYVWDPHLRLYHVRHRVYDPRDGRWLQRDPIGYAGGNNLYEYCGGDPVGKIDPLGLDGRFDTKQQVEPTRPEHRPPLAKPRDGRGDQPLRVPMHAWA